MQREQILIDKILSNGQKEVENILENAKNECEKILLSKKNDESKWLKNEIEKIKRKNSEQIENYKKNLFIEQNKFVLNEKNKIIDNIFQKLQERFENMDNDEYSQLLNKILENAKVGDGIIISDRKNEKKFISSLPIFKEKKLKIIEQTSKISGGVIIVSEDYDLDFSFSSLIEEKKQQVLIMLAKELF